jgi:hypothetical protein
VQFLARVQPLSESFGATEPIARRAGGGDATDVDMELVLRAHKLRIDGKRDIVMA